MKASEFVKKWFVTMKKDKCLSCTKVRNPSNISYDHECMICVSLELHEDLLNAERKGELGK